MLRSRSGDSEATTELIRAYQGRVFALCRHMLDSREDAADVTQEVLIKVVTRLDTFDGRSALGTWVYRIATNACLTQLRRQRSRRLTTGLGGEEAEKNRSESALDAEPEGIKRVERDEDVSILRLALRSLSEEARALLVLRDGRGLDYASIGVILGLAQGTVKSRLFRARKALREAMESLAPSDEDGPGSETNPLSASGRKIS